jgi:hypothetical protein
VSGWEQPKLPARATAKHEIAMQRPVDLITLLHSLCPQQIVCSEGWYCDAEIRQE